MYVAEDCWGTVRVILGVGVYVCYIYVKSQDRVYNECLVQKLEKKKAICGLPDHIG